MSPTNLDIGHLIRARYRIDEIIEAPGLRTTYRGTDTVANEPFCAVCLTAAEQSVVSRFKEFAHAHVAAVRDVVTESDGSVVLISEPVLGQTVEAYVREHLAEHQHTPVDGVRLVLRLADAVAHAHAAGAHHGSIGPLSVIAVPTGRPGPVLTFSGWLETDSVFFLAGKRGEEEPSEAGDAWAVAGLLYYFLVGREPPPGGVRTVEELHACGVLDAPLTDALLTGLNVDESLRAKSLKPLRRDLARWFVDHVGDEPVSQGIVHSNPPPLPAGRGSSPVIMTGASVAPAESVPRPSRTSVAPGGRSKKGLVVWAASALVFGLVCAFGISQLRVPPPEPQAPRVAKSEPAPQKKAIDLSEVSVMGEDQALSANKTASCVSGYLPKGAFTKAPDLEWLCTERDPRQGADRLRAAIVAGAAVAPSETMRLYGRLGWYDMAAFAVVRAGCCGNPEALELPPPSSKCQSLGAALDDVGHAVVSSGEVGRALEAYAAAVQCEIAAGRAKDFKHGATVDGGESSTFKELIKGVIQP
ncbi:MAG: hypothetical protein SFV15_11890 [Polyangiaceae bacterium]|nr:hypothetical protein [Polyangiaceae bacterium]